MQSSARVMAGMLAAVALAGCGGGSGTASTAMQVGPWSGTYSLGSSSGTTKATTGALSSNDDGYFADNNGFVYVLSSLPGISPFTATLTGIAPPGQTFANGNSTVTFSVSGTDGTAVSGFNMQGTFTENDSHGTLSGNFNLDSGNPYTGTLTLAGLQGQWSGYYIGTAGTSINMNFGPDGTFAGNDGYGCLLSGGMSPDTPNVNLYDVSFASSGVNCIGSLSGLAYISSTDVTGAFGGASGTYVYMMVSDSLAAYVIELKM